MNPILLHPDSPHHAHRRMIESVDGSFVQASGGGPIDRIREAYKKDLSDEIVIAEGAAPLFQAAWMKIFGNLDTLLYLAADEGMMNIVGDVDHYGLQEDIAHSWAYRYVDGVLGVSPRLVSEARTTGRPTRLIFPSTTDERWRALGETDTDLENERVLSIGSHTENNNFGVLCNINHKIDIVGERTGEIDCGEVQGHGFVSEERLLDFFSTSGLFVLPATEQPFPVVVLEAMRAGIPPLISTGTGTAPYVQTVAPQLVKSPDEIAESIHWYSELEVSNRKKLSEASRSMSQKFSPDNSRRTFREKYNELLMEV